MIGASEEVKSSPVTDNAISFLNYCTGCSRAQSLGISEYCAFSFFEYLGVPNLKLNRFSPVEDIGIHVHVFAGSLDELCSPRTSALLADTLKLGTLHLVRGVGHISAMMECWQVFLFPPSFQASSVLYCDSPAFRRPLLSLQEPAYPLLSFALCCPFNGCHRRCLCGSMWKE